MMTTYDDNNINSQHTVGVVGQKGWREGAGQFGGRRGAHLTDGWVGGAQIQHG